MSLFSDLSGAIGGVVALVLFVGVIALLRSLIRVCPSNHILVVTGGTETLVNGRKFGFRIQKGGWTYVIPFIQSVQAIDLTIIPINVRVEGVNSANGIDVGADATACVIIDDENETLLYSAVQQLLGKPLGLIQEQIQQTMVGNFRAALNKTTPLQAIGMVESAEGVEDVELISVAEAAFGKGTVQQAAEGNVNLTNVAGETDYGGERAIFRRLLLEDCREDLSAFGIDVVSVSLQRIWDSSNYIANLANKTLSRKRQDVEIEEARLRALADQAESDGKRRMMVALNQADERILQVQQEVELFRRKCDADINRARLEAVSAVSQAQSQCQRQVEELKVDFQQLKNQSGVTVEAEIRRRAAEVMAQGGGEAMQIVQGVRNDLLERKVTLLSQSGDAGRIAYFFTQLPALFQAYQTHAKDLYVDNMLVLNEEDGFNAAVNRGPAAMVDFLAQFEKGFGISVRDLLSHQAPSGQG